MNIQEQEFENQSLRRYVKISLILHVAIFLSLTIKATLFSDKEDPFEQAIRVDIVGLPDRVTEPAPKEEAKTPEKTPEKKEEAAVKPEVQKPKLPTKEKPKVQEEAINLNKTKSKQ